MSEKEEKINQPNDESRSPQQQNKESLLII